jgi:1-acyl-sn-glycerol-3-phosphate acyltransferase
LDGREADADDLVAACKSAAVIELALIGLTRFLVGGHPHWQGTIPSDRQRIYFANHGSNLDTLLLWAALPAHMRAITHPVAAQDYWGRSMLRRWLATRVLNSVLIDRSGSNTGEDVLAPLRAKLTEGHSLIIFPEGTRSDERLPGPFKAGLFSLAGAYPNAELVPVFLENLNRAFPKGALFPVPITCAVRFGTPISLRPNESKDEFLARARAAIIALA